KGAIRALLSLVTSPRTPLPNMSQANPSNLRSLSWCATDGKAAPTLRSTVLERWPSWAMSTAALPSSSTEPPVEGFVARHDDPGRKHLSCPNPRRLTQGEASGRITDQGHEGAGRRGDVAGGYQLRSQRASAALRAILRRCSGESALARACPPRPPRARGG